MKDLVNKPLSSGNLKKLLELVKTHTGITMEERKRDLLGGRLRRRIRELNLESVDAYLEYLDKTASEKQQFIDMVTTNETHFFRTEAVWKFFNEIFLSAYLKEKFATGGTLRVWSAAASTGAEAYSISMLCEEAKLKNPLFRYQIVGSDISSDVLSQARGGVYSGKIVEELKMRYPALYAKYFRETAPLEAKVSDELRKNIDFSFHHLHKSPNRNEFYDVVFLRNVLIYFSEPDQELVLRHIYDSLRPNGFLIIGESESLTRLKTDFHYCEPLIYQKKAA